MLAENERYVEHNLEHYRQRYNWDCGVSCVLMLLSPDQREEMLDNFEQICLEEGFRQSTWTIDLCYLLKRFGIRHCMYTTLLGVNEDYKRYGYYDRIINMDRERVKRRFKEAKASSIDVQKHSLTHAEMLRHLATAGPVIVLVDASMLVCDLCKHNKLKAEFRRCFGGAYTGHYIVVVGYSGHKLLYRDPALAPRLCAAAPQRLARARRAAGTDEDAVLLYRDYRSRDISFIRYFSNGPSIFLVFKTKVATLLVVFLETCYKCTHHTLLPATMLPLLLSLNTRLYSLLL